MSRTYDEEGDQPMDDTFLDEHLLMMDTITKVPTEYKGNMGFHLKMRVSPRHAFTGRGMH
ncbi:hypothetical protein Mapa_000404 [Marchantia paleacea]|nr:hypothetical protein Mapa_000404 [Marchantia paleacea]